MSAVLKTTPEPAPSTAPYQSAPGGPSTPRSGAPPSSQPSDGESAPPRSDLSPVRLYRTEWVAADTQRVRIPHGCVAVVEKPDTLSLLGPGEHPTDPLLTPHVTGFWLHTVWTAPVPVYLRVKARSRDGWPLRLALLAVVQVTDPALVVQAPRPDQDLRGLLTSAVMQAIGEHNALALNGAAPGPTVREALTAIIALYVAEVEAGRGVPGLALRRLDIVRPWTDAGLVERLQQRSAPTAAPSESAAPQAADPPPPPSDTAAPERVAAVAPPPAPDPPPVVQPDLPPAPPPAPPAAPAPPPEPPTALVEGVVRQLVYAGYLRLPKARREGLPPGETLDPDTVAYLRALVAQEWASQPPSEEGAHGRQGS